MQVKLTTDCSWHIPRQMTKKFCLSCINTYSYDNVLLEPLLVKVNLIESDCLAAYRSNSSGTSEITRRTILVGSVPKLTYGEGHY